MHSLLSRARRAAVRGLASLLMMIGIVPGALAQVTLPGGAAAGVQVPTTVAVPAIPMLQTPAMVIPSPDAEGREAGTESGRPGARRPYAPGEFERFVRSLAGSVGPGGQPLQRYGAALLTGNFDLEGGSLAVVAPADYLVAPGDELLVTLWGSVNADLRLVVDRNGRISIPRVGTVQAGGVRHADLHALIERRVAQVFRNFELSVALGQLRGRRVLVTGFVTQPGTYTVGALSTVLGTLMQAGGPSPSGGFRNVELRRGGKVVARLDLYDLLRNGDRSGDHFVQAGDVVHVGPVGTQVALVGSVNQPAVFEIRPGETVGDVLAMAGGLSTVADRSRLAVERLIERNSVRIRELDLPADLGATLADGDVVRAFSAVSTTQPVQRQNKRVIVEGEVARPGMYVLPAASSLGDALRSAGGLTAQAYVYGAEFMRESVRTTQRENYERALRDLETEFTRNSATQRIGDAQEATALTAQNAAVQRLLSRLRAIEPNGRVVLNVDVGANDLPDLALEDGDRLYIPPRPTTVGVFGSVFNAGSYLHGPDRRLDDYLRLAGGPTRGADNDSVFVIRANGSVVSARQDATWYRASRLPSLNAEPGDTIFVPEELNKTTFLRAAKDWTQVLSQFALGVAAFKVLND